MPICLANKTHRVVLNPHLCIGCFSCVVACKQEHQLPLGVNWIRIHRIDGTKSGGEPSLAFKINFCQHCKNPLCLPVCPSDAIMKREDGIVVIDDNICTGCQLCINACPFDAIEYDATRGVASKCTLCFHRLEQNLEPSCVTCCPAKAISTAI